MYHFNSVATEHEEFNRVEILVNASRMMILKNLYDALKTSELDDITRIVAKRNMKTSNFSLTVHIAAAGGIPGLVEDWIFKRRRC